MLSSTCVYVDNCPDWIKVIYNVNIAVYVVELQQNCSLL